MLSEIEKSRAVQKSSESLDSGDYGFPEFTDLYLPSQFPEYGISWPGPAPLTQEMHFMAKELVEIAKKKNSVDFSVMSHGIPFRGTMMPTLNETFYIFRRMPTKVWSLADCGIRGRIADYILDERLCKGGLIIVSGMPGQGKSTTCAAIVVGRLEKFGGLCITVEDPVEMPLQGFHGNGVCLQRNLLGEQSFHVAVREAMRGYPAQANSIMLIGEVRDHQTAALALRSAVDGRLVVLTLHAGTIIQAVQRIVSLASIEMGVEEARALLASSVRLVMNQKIVTVENPDPDKKPDKRLKVTTLFDTNAVSGIIMTKEASLESLKNEIQNQMNKLRLKMEIKPRNLDD
jgi:Tfp pilus assembly pilus retraction ATPase PilT